MDTEKSERLVNSRFACVSVSHGQHDAQIYTNHEIELARDLSRDVSQRTATESQGQEPAAEKNHTVAIRSKGRASVIEVAVWICQSDLSFTSR